MEKITSSQAEIIRKRKLHDELVEMPLSKHVCRNQHVEHGSSSNYSTEPKKVESDEFYRGGESDPESTNSNSLHFNSDSIMFTDDDTKTDLEYPNATPDECSTSSARSAGTYSENSLYTSDSRSSTSLSSSEPMSLSIAERPYCPHYKYDECPLECGNHSDFNSSEYITAASEQCTDKELEDLLCLNGVAPSSNYILSSGRWSVDKDTQQEGKKLTIDKEFEQYFSMLML